MLSTLQGLLLLGSYHTAIGKIGLAYMYAGIGLRMSQTLGLGIDCSGYVRRGVLTEEVKNNRDRVLWLAFVQDKLWSSYVRHYPLVLLSSILTESRFPFVTQVGRNPTLFRNQLETALPTINAERDRQTWSPLPADVEAGSSSTSSRRPVLSNVSSVFHETAKLAIIEEKIMASMFVPFSSRVFRQPLNSTPFSATLYGPRTILRLF